MTTDKCIVVTPIEVATDERRIIHEASLPDGRTVNLFDMKDSPDPVGEHFHKNKEEIFVLVRGDGFFYSYPTTEDPDSIQPDAIFKEKIDAPVVIHVPANMIHSFILAPGSIMVGYSSGPFDNGDMKKIPIVAKKEEALANKQLIDSVANRVAEIMADVPWEHGLSHIERVVENACNIAQAEKLDKKTTLCLVLAAWLHDIGRTKESRIAGEKSNHAACSAEMAAPILIEAGLEQGSVQEVIEAIAAHSNKGAAPTFIGQILQDADKLDGFGQDGFHRAIAFWCNLSPEEVQSYLEEGQLSLDPSIHAEIQKLVGGLDFIAEWYAWLNTESAKEMGLVPYDELLGYRQVLKQML